MNTIDNLFEPAFPEMDNEKWENYLKTIKKKILWYPSSGNDFSLFTNYKRDKIENFFDEIPTVIFSDITDENYFFQEGIIINRESIVTINFRIPVKYKEMPENSYLIQRIDIPNPADTPDNFVEQDNLSSFRGIFKPKCKQEIIEVLQAQGTTWENYYEKYNNKSLHGIWLINFDAKENGCIIRNQNVLYFFWDNITFFEIIVNKEGLPVNHILSNRDSMDDSNKSKFIEYLFKKTTITHLLSDNRIFAGGRIEDINMQLHYYQNNRLIGEFNKLSDYQWNDVDSIGIFEVLRD